MCVCTTVKMLRCGRIMAGGVAIGLLSPESEVCVTALKSRTGSQPRIRPLPNRPPCTRSWLPNPFPTRLFTRLETRCPVVLVLAGAAMPVARVTGPVTWTGSGGRRWSRSPGHTDDRGYPGRSSTEVWAGTPTLATWAGAFVGEEPIARLVDWAWPTLAAP